MTDDEQLFILDVDQDETVENLKALSEEKTRVPQLQQLLYNGIVMRNNEKLGALGVGDRDLIVMVFNSSSSNARASPNESGFSPDGSAVNPLAFQQQLRNYSNVMTELFQSDPELAQAILGNGLNMIQDISSTRNRQRGELWGQREEEMKAIDEIWAAAIDYNPEAFAKEVMVYVDMEVNSVPLKAIVSSAAQSTIISKSCAERCGLSKLIDTRYRGIARGVGQSEIIGRIHVAPIKIGKIFYPCSFTVLDSPNMEFLFGFDMLYKFQCTIDLKENVLRVGLGEVSVPFLTEDILSSLFDEKRYTKEVSSSGVQGPDFEAKVAKFVELGIEREQVIKALKASGGNEDLTAIFLLLGGY
ncbi:DNA damage-inducible protein 1-like isoform X2 [Olea europaea var. sylvestris]|uniref:DNA damage-inducible protein 1-like isoform X2 n=1 Tax=Olea europaea var. sylvestris TaxID=158386 RepID=UPI000C1D849D|nr:DNA damage-inducible protein 1-like isoform X2 [Olea europaea var. sylvestris]